MVLVSEMVQSKDERLQVARIIFGRLNERVGLAVKSACKPNYHFITVVSLSVTSHLISYLSPLGM